MQTGRGEGKKQGIPPSMQARLLPHVQAPLPGRLAARETAAPPAKKAPQSPDGSRNQGLCPPLDTEGVVGRVMSPKPAGIPATTAQHPPFGEGLLPMRVRWVATRDSNAGGSRGVAGSAPSTPSGGRGSVQRSSPLRPSPSTHVSRFALMSRALAAASLDI